MTDYLVRNDLEFSKISQLKNPVIHKLSSAPNTPVQGQIYYNTTLNKLGFYNNTTWIYGYVDSIVAGSNKISIDNTDASNPEIDVVVSNLIDDTQSTTTNIYSASKVDDNISQAIANVETGADWQASVLDIQVDNTLNPSLTTGARYILTNISNLNANFGTISGVVNNDIVEYNGSAFVVAGSVTIAGKGMTTFVEASNVVYTYNGTAWVVMFRVTGFTAGNGLSQVADVVSVNVDDTTIEIVAGDLQVKDLGITNEKLAGSITDDKLNQITTANKVAGSAVQLNATGALEDDGGLNVIIDDATIGKNGSNQLYVKNNGIKSTQLGTTYTATFLSTDFVSGVLTITQATQNTAVPGITATGNKSVTVYDSSNNEVIFGKNVATNGNVTISVNTGSEFDGRIIITQNAG